MSVMMKGFIMKNVIKDGSVRHKEGFMGEYDGHEANIVEVRNGKTSYAKLDNDDIMKMIGVRSNENDLEDRLKEMLSDDTGHGSHPRNHHRSHPRSHHRSHPRSHHRSRPRSRAKHAKHKRKHTKRKRKHTKHKRKHTKRKRKHTKHKRKHTKHKRKHKRSIRAKR